MKTAKAVTVSLLAMTVVAALAACDPIIDSGADVAVGVSSGQVLFVSCLALEQPGVVRAATRDFAVNGSEWQTFLETEFVRPIEPRVPFGPGELPEESRTQIEKAAVVRPGETISLFIQLPATSSSLHARFVVPDTGLQDGGWLRPDGEMYSDPCPA